MRLPDSPPSLWLDTYGPYEPEPPLAGDLSVDIAIIGGGFTGIMTAYEVLRDQPGTRVAVLEHQVVGYGASGRNGSFGMTVVGLGFAVNAMLRGKGFVLDAHRYMERAVDCMEELIRREGLACDMIRPGFLRVATTRSYVKKLAHEVELVRSLGIEGIDWIDAAAMRQKVDSARFLGAMWEPRLVLVNPAKLVREEKRAAMRLGARVFENTPVLEVMSRPRLRLTTPGGTVTAEKVVFATNAYSHLSPALRRKQVPAFTYMVATEPLTGDQLAPIGWKGREGLEDCRNLIHYYRLTPDNRLVMGGGPVGLSWANRLDRESSQPAFSHLERHIRFLFPSLAGARITHRWGGPFSVTADLTPAIGLLGDGRAAYSLGCIGHGVSMSHLNAQTLRDLILGRESDLTGCPFVNRRVIPWPPEPLRIGIAASLRAYLQVEDWVRDREPRRGDR